MCVFYCVDVDVRKGVAPKDVHALKCGPGCKCVDCQNVSSARAPSGATDDSEVEPG